MPLGGAHFKAKRSQKSLLIDRGFLREIGLFGKRNTAIRTLISPTVCHTSLHRLRAAIEQELHRADPPTAVFALTNHSALATIKAARGLGLEIPGDLSVVGFDDVDWMSALRPYLTTVAQPIEDLAAASWRLLMQRVAGIAGEASVRIELPCVLKSAGIHRVCQQTVESRGGSPTMRGMRQGRFQCSKGPILGASAAALAVALSTSAGAADKPVYGVLMKTLSNPFWGAMEQGVHARRRCPGVEYFLQAVEFDQAAEPQLNTCNTMLEKKRP